jgi:hypothetical protein
MKRLDRTTISKLIYRCVWEHDRFLRAFHFAVDTAIPDCDCHCDNDDDSTYWILVWYLGKLVVASLPWLGFFGVLWSDLDLVVAISGNLAASPSSYNAALYWTHFVAKSLPFISL